MASSVSDILSAVQSGVIALNNLAAQAVGSFRAIKSRFLDLFDVKDFGAVGDGVTDDTSSFQAAINSVASGAGVSIFVPTPSVSYKLSSNVINNGRIVSWKIASGVPFTGAGALPSFTSDNYGGMSIKNSQVAFLRGSSAVPDGTAGALQITQLHSNSTGTTTQNPAAAFFATKYTTTPGTRVQGIYVEAEDNVGWTGVGAVNFIEGTRSQATLAGGVLGSAYGVVSAAGENVGVTHTYLIGNESEVDNNSANAPAIFNNNSFTSSYLATSRGTKTVDTAFAVNPFTDAVAEYVRGFYVPSGATNTPVSESGFRTDAGSTWGVYVGGASFGSVRIPNNVPVRGSNALGTIDLNILNVNASDQLVLGTDATAVTSVQLFSAPGYVCRSGTAGAYGGNAFNLFWTGAATQLWIDATNTGTITVVSDYRIKKDVADAAPALAELLQWRPITYTGKAWDIFKDNDAVRHSFIAHELQAISPDCVIGEKDGEQPQSLDLVPIVARLVKAVQELSVEVTALKVGA